MQLQPIDIMCIIGCIVALFTEILLGQLMYLVYSYEALRKIYLIEIFLTTSFSLIVLALFVVTKNYIYLAFTFALVLAGAVHVSKIHKIYTLIRCVACRENADKAGADRRKRGSILRLRRTLLRRGV